VKNPENGYNGCKDCNGCNGGVDLEGGFGGKVVEEL
jgi:hypothetical protein